jgi:dTDP-4-dehydrorhamnose 3,5-epimerase
VRFEDIGLPGGKLVRGDPWFDQRGSFERIWCADEFGDHGIDPSFMQSSISWNEVAGTRRGLHFQRGAHAECKLVRCISGSLYDVLVDIRPTSPTYGKWYGVTLAANDHLSLFIPEGFAHGFQTLVNDTAVLYFISKPYSAAHAMGISTDDPALAIDWPGPATRISKADCAWPNLSAIAPGRS